jgi:excisionase family DNA binding protein
MNNPRESDSAKAKPAPVAVLLTVAEAAKYLRVSKSFLDKSRVSGGGPEFIRIGKRKILYRTSALDFWANARRYSSTSEYIS